MVPRSEHSKGLAYGLSAYLVWGLFPLYWPLLRPAGAVEILAHRMAWSLVFLAGLNTARNKWPQIKLVLRNRRLLGLLSAAAVLITINWGLYIWAVNADHVIDASLGYFMNPLMNVALGILIMRERLRKLQWVAVSIAAIGVLWMTLDSGQVPWIGLILGLSFSSYGMLKKVAGVEGVESLTVETILLFPFAIGYLVWIESAGQAAFLHTGTWQAIWSIMAGVVTAVPLIWFSAAAIRIPYSTMGLMQFITPTMQFLIGYLIRGEAMSSARWAGFIVIWVALVLFTTDAWRNGRNIVSSDE